MLNVTHFVYYFNIILMFIAVLEPPEPDTDPLTHHRSVDRDSSETDINRFIFPNYFPGNNKSNSLSNSKN